MEGLLTHRSFWEDLIGRLGGPITFRLILQPSIAVILAIRDGLKDAKAGRPLYFWSLFTHSTERRQLLKDGWKSVGFVFVFAIVIVVQSRVSPGSLGKLSSLRHPDETTGREVNDEGSSNPHRL